MKKGKKKRGKKKKKKGKGGLKPPSISRFLYCRVLNPDLQSESSGGKERGRKEKGGRDERNLSLVRSLRSADQGGQKGEGGGGKGRKNTPLVPDPLFLRTSLPMTIETKGEKRRKSASLQDQLTCSWNFEEAAQRKAQGGERRRGTKKVRRARTFRCGEGKGRKEKKKEGGTDIRRPRS